MPNFDEGHFNIFRKNALQKLLEQLLWKCLELSP